MSEPAFDSYVAAVAAIYEGVAIHQRAALDSDAIASESASLEERARRPLLELGIDIPEGDLSGPGRDPRRELHTLAGLLELEREAFGLAQLLKAATTEPHTFRAMVEWQSRASALLGGVQHAGTARSPDLAQFIDRMNAALMERSAIAEDYAKYLTSVNGASPLRWKLLRLAEPLYSYAPLATWRESALLAVAAADQAVQSQSGEVALRTSRLRELIEQFHGIMQQFAFEETQLRGRVQAAESELSSIRSKLAGAQSAIQKAYGTAFWNAFLGALAGGLVTGFGGCFYGPCAEGERASAGLASGGAIGLLIGAVIGFLMKIEDITTATRELQRLGAALASRHASREAAEVDLSRHEQLRLPAVDRKV